MSELRKDYLLDRWVIISEKREQRPKQFKKLEIVKDQKTCYFCPGNEDLTPKEIGRVEEKGAWKIRWFPNKFPAVLPAKALKKQKTPFFEKMNAFGYHEVIAETPNHNKQLWDLSKEDIAQLLKVYSLRIKHLSKKKNAEYVLIFKNHGREGGTSLIHSHTQLMTYPKIPELVKDKIKAVKKHRSCPYCSIIKKERKSKRFIFENKSFIAFCPFASRYNYEAWIFPKAHLKNITELNNSQFLDLADTLQKILKKLKNLGCSFNYHLHYSPKKENLHFHIEITPRIATWGGFEIQTNAVINSVSPEQAARFYRSR